MAIPEFTFKQLEGKEVEFDNIPEFVDSIRNVCLLAALYDALMLKKPDIEHMLYEGNVLRVCDGDRSYTVRSMQSMMYLREYIRASLVRIGLQEVGTQDLGELLSYTNGKFRTEIFAAQAKWDARPGAENLATEMASEPKHDALDQSDNIKLTVPNTSVLYPTFAFYGGEFFRTIGSKTSESSELHILDKEFNTLLVIQFSNNNCVSKFCKAIQAHIEFTEQQSEHT